MSFRLRVRARFGAFRSLTAGSLRPSAPFMTPSAAYGLLLNLAGIESRLDDGKSVDTQTRPNLPTFEIALGLNKLESGLPQLPEDQSIFQQLHNYPVGNSGKEHQEACRGNKYNIQPIRRAFLSDLDMLICIREAPELVAQIRQALAQGLEAPLLAEAPRYGIPFLGDNNFMIDVLQEEFAPLSERYWLVKSNLRQSLDTIKRPQRYRLPVWIDRAFMPGTQSELFELTEMATTEIPADQHCWIQVGPPILAETGSVA